MIVELQCGDRIAIPEGCKAIVNGNEVVVEKEEKEEVQEFKDGDILVTATRESRHNAFIYKGTDKYGFHSYYVGIDLCSQLFICEHSSNRWNNANLDYDTEEEKQLLFDKMKEQGLRWNAEKKKVEKIRWRADVGEKYYFIDSSLDVLHIEECWRNLCNEHYSAYNYFRTKEQAEEAAKRVKETLRKYYEEIGE